MERRFAPAFQRWAAEAVAAISSDQTPPTAAPEPPARNGNDATEPFAILDSTAAIARYPDAWNDPEFWKADDEARARWILEANSSRTKRLILGFVAAPCVASPELSSPPMPDTRRLADFPRVEAHRCVVPSRRSPSDVGVRPRRRRHGDLHDASCHSVSVCVCQGCDRLTFPRRAQQRTSPGSEERTMIANCTCCATDEYVDCDDVSDVAVCKGPGIRSSGCGNRRKNSTRR